METLDMVADLAPVTVLDVGVFPPLAFEAMLVNALPGVALHGVWEGPDPYYQQVRSRAAGLPDFDIRLEAGQHRTRPAGPMTTPASTSFWAWRSSNISRSTRISSSARRHRVLAPGGHVLLTTPNIASHRGVWKVLNGQSAHSFGLFVPTGGVYGRHNREYAPREVEALARAAGFETRVLKTVDVYDDAIDPGTAELLCARDDLSLRGETIFYLGRKTGTPGDAPEGFYHGDPVRMSGALEVARTTRRGPAWCASGSAIKARAGGRERMVPRPACWPSGSTRTGSCGIPMPSFR